MSRRRRVVFTLLAVVFGAPALVIVAYSVWRPTPPKGGPRIGLSMASGFVVQRPFYEDALARAGGRTVFVTPTNDDARLAAMLDQLDALLLSGGDDVDPALYDGDPHQAGSTNRHRDEFEIRLIGAALDRNMPILGICRGIQILNVAHGGGIRDLRADGALSERHGIGVGSLAAHDVNVVAGTRLAGAIGPGRRRVNSFHGQAVGRVGAELRICAAAGDGVIEGIERPDRPFVIGVQWHPEIASYADKQSLRLFQALVREADAYRKAERGKRAIAPRE